MISQTGVESRGLCQVLGPGARNHQPCWIKHLAVSWTMTGTPSTGTSQREKFHWPVAFVYLFKSRNVDFRFLRFRMLERLDLWREERGKLQLGKGPGGVAQGQSEDK